MISKTQKEIQATKAKLAKLEKQAEAELNKRISNLHKEAGFATREELIEELQSLGTTPRRGRKPAAKKAKKAAAKKAKKAAAPKAKKAAAKKGGAKKRAKRTAITPELRKSIVDALKGGGKGAAVAKQFGVSLPTVHNIKKAAGLTKARK